MTSRISNSPEGSYTGEFSMISIVKSRTFALRLVLVAVAFVIWTTIFAVPVAAMTWDSEIVQTGIPGHWPVNSVDSLVLDSSGNPHMAYYDFTGDDQGRLLYAERQGGVWSVETIETTGTTDPYPSLTLDPSGESHVCYFNATALVHAWLTGEGWQREVVETVEGLYISSAFDSSGDLHLVYYASTAGNRSLRYAVWDGGAWSDEEIVPEANQFFSSLAVANDGAVHIAYVNGKTGNLIYRGNDGSGWDSGTEVAGVGQNNGSRPGYTSIALDDAGIPAIAYYNLTSEALGYAWFEEGGWQHEDVTAAKGDRASLAFDGNGLPAIAFTSDDVNVTYAWKENGRWEFSQIVAAGRLGSGGYPGLAMTADGSPRLSCRTGPHDSLEYIRSVPEPFAANFSANVTSGHAPLAVHFTDESTGEPDSWAWDFGDGETGIDQNPDYLYTIAGVYDVSLTASDASSEDTLVRECYVTVLPRALFSANMTSGTAPLAVLFTDESTGEPDSWVWDFGDGNTSSEPESVHVYETVGNYSVSLTVAKGDLQNTTILKEEIVVLPAPTTEPTAEPTSPPSSSEGDGDGDTPYAIAAAGDLKAGENVTLRFDRSAISAITFTAGERIEGIMVTLEQADEGPSDLDGPVYQYIEATLSYTREDALQRTTFFFDVPENWLAAEGLGVGDIVLWRYDDGTWAPLFTELVQVNGGRAYYRASSPGFSYFAVAAGKGMTFVAAESAASVGEVVEETTEPQREEVTTPPVSSVTSTTALPATTTDAQPSPAGFLVLFLSLALVVLIIRHP